LPDDLLPNPGFEAETPWVVWSEPAHEGNAEGSGNYRGGAIFFYPRCGEGQRQALNASTPLTALGNTCVLYIHGGAFEGGSSHSSSAVHLCSRLAVETGTVVICPDHLLSGHGRPFEAPVIVNQLVQDLLWLVRNDPLTKEARNTSAGGPPKLVLLGDSSGATQAFSVLIQIARDHPDVLECIRGVAMLSPWLDLSCGSHTYVSNAYECGSDSGDVMFREPADENRATFRQCATTYLGSEDLLQDWLYSPYWLARSLSSGSSSGSTICNRDVNGRKAVLARLMKAQVRLWMCIGAAESLAGETLDLAQRLRGKLPVEAWLHEGAFHVWMLFNASRPFASREAAMRNLANFTRRALGTGDVDISLTQDLYAGINYYIDEW